VEWIKLCMNAALLVLCNPIPEVIYQKRLQSMSGIQYAFEFASSYFLEWFIPLFLLLAPLLAVASPQDIVRSIVSTEVLLPPAVLVSAWSVAGGSAAVQLSFAVLGVAVGLWYMLFRAYLFRALDSGRDRRVN
jgi:hypothetical protein